MHEDPQGIEAHDAYINSQVVFQIFNQMRVGQVVLYDPAAAEVRGVLDDLVEVSG